MTGLSWLDYLTCYKDVNEKIVKVAFTTFIRHLWYLSSDLVGFSLFSQKLSMGEKREIMTQMKKEKKLDRKRWVLKERNGDEITTSLSDLASSATLRFLKSLCIRETFLEVLLSSGSKIKIIKRGGGRSKN